MMTEKVPSIEEKVEDNNILQNILKKLIKKFAYGKFYIWL